MNRFFKWFKGSLEDATGTASFRRIYNWLIISLVMFLVVWHAVYYNLSKLILYEILILLIAGFLNIGVITIDNILRFMNRNKDNDKPDDDKPEETKTATISGEVKLNDIKPEQQ